MTEEIVTTEAETGREAVFGIPPFQGDPIPYFLPDGIWPCTWSQFRDRYFALNQRRTIVCSAFLFMLEQLYNLGINVDFIYIDGSFITARSNPGDVDACCVVTPENLRRVIADLTKKMTSPDGAIARQAALDRNTVLMYAKQPHQIKSITGTHFFMFENEEICQRDMVNFFRGLSRPDNRPPDPRDPVGLVRPMRKGVLKVDFREYFTSRGI